MWLMRGITGSEYFGKDHIGLMRGSSADMGEARRRPPLALPPEVAGFPGRAKV